MIESRREDIMDDLSDYVLEVAVRLSFDIGWRRIAPILEEARATADPRAYIEDRVGKLAVLEAASRPNDAKPGSGAASAQTETGTQTALV